MIKVQVTLTNAQDHRRRSKVTQNKQIVISRKVLKPIDIIPGTKVQCNKRHLMT